MLHDLGMSSRNFFKDLRSHGFQEKQARVGDFALFPSGVKAVPLRNRLRRAFAEPGDFRGSAAVFDDLFVVHTQLKHTFKPAKGMLSLFDVRMLT